MDIIMHYDIIVYAVYYAFRIHNCSARTCTRYAHRRDDHKICKVSTYSTKMNGIHAGVFHLEKCESFQLFRRIKSRFSWKSMYSFEG